MTLRERLERSADPIAARRLLERRPALRGRRRISARLVPPGEDFRHWALRQGCSDLADRINDQVQQ
ncbi:MAG: hypothetical protein ACE15B_06905 [Bryobacteraceae bacterium]